MDKTINTQGNLFVISAPSGAGKSSLIKELIRLNQNLVLSVSFTSRKPRYSESNGKEYFFVSVEDFLKKKEKGEFIESAFIHGNFYGTSFEHIKNKLNQGIDIILELDWQGKRKIKEIYEKAICIFILPPSLDELRKRLYKRDQNTEDEINRRFEAALTEISHASKYEYVIINGDFNEALNKLMSIILSIRCKFINQAINNKTLFEEYKIS